MGIYIKGMEMPTGKVATIEIHPDGSVFTLKGREIGNAVQAEDIRPVIHSFWGYNPGDNIPYCDNCGMPQDVRSDFCHSCGADMRPTFVSGAKKLSKPRWIPVTERLPEEDTDVLCWYEYYHWSAEKVLPEYGIGHCWKGRWGGEVSSGRECKVLAWMPLPEPPKEEI